VLGGEAGDIPIEGVESLRPGVKTRFERETRPLAFLQALSSGIPRTLT
jgi:hypothetical protein